MVEATAGQALILTGPPGAGKSTVAGLLTRGWSGPAVHIHSDDFWSFIKSGRIAPFLPEAHGQNRTVIDALAGVARTYVAGGYFVVVDGIVGPWFLPPFREALSAVALHYIVLRPDLATTLRRARERREPALRDVDPIGGLHRQFAALGDLEAHAMDTSGQDAAETLAEVRTAIETEAFRLLGICSAAPRRP